MAGADVIQTDMRVLDETAFTVADRPYSFSDVVAAATHWGDWARLEADVRRDVAHLRLHASKGRIITTAEIGKAADQFRYDRDLLSGEQSQAWLNAWGLDVPEWLDYIQRTVVRARYAGDDLPVRRPDGGDIPGLERLVLIEAICSGELVRFAHRLAGRVAIASVRRRDGPAEDAGRMPGRFSRLESEFCRFSREILTPAALAERLARSQMSWTRATCTWLCFTDLDRANEGLLCLREDGEPPETVAAAAGAQLRAGAFFVEDLETELRDRVLSAACGQWTGPFRVEGGFAVLVVHDRIPPLLTDTDVRSRVEHAVVSAAVDQHIAAQVTWSPRLKA